MEILRNTEDLRNKFTIDIIKYNLKYQQIALNESFEILIWNNDIDMRSYRLIKNPEPKLGVWYA